MKRIVTLTLNPSIDGACAADTVRHTHKVRTSNARYDPGGGGINVARVVARLGGRVTPVYFAGGATGLLLDKLLRSYPFHERYSIPIIDDTRISTSVFERESGHEFRFVPEGPQVRPPEWGACLKTLERLDFDWMVLSGSSPLDFPVEGYGEIAALARRKGARFVLDSSGPAFAAAMAAGGVDLAKPSLGEFRALTGAALETAGEVEAAAREMVAGGGVRRIAVTMGHEGAMLAGPEGVRWLRPPDVPVHSAVGAGDSFLGAMVHGLARGDSVDAAFAMGVAAGAAAVITPGTDLCRPEDVARLYGELAGEDAGLSPSGG